MEVVNPPFNQLTEWIKIRLKRLADNCVGKVLQIVTNKAMLRFPTPDYAARSWLIRPRYGFLHRTTLQGKALTTASELLPPWN
ncbi:putative limkain b1 [Operophtera brumata]|uniref:Putative limkain b1 n=1 Tax=Operophtera brumata TaxID=104452 RepID=A0A0L7L6L0_OPEBR|nr:putative limkain b1 [Operophtera brumata]